MIGDAAQLLSNWTVQCPNSVSMHIYSQTESQGTRGTRTRTTTSPCRVRIQILLLSPIADACYSFTGGYESSPDTIGIP